MGVQVTDHKHVKHGFLHDKAKDHLYIHSYVSNVAWDCNA